MVYFSSPLVSNILLPDFKTNHLYLPVSSFCGGPFVGGTSTAQKRRGSKTEEVWICKLKALTDSPQLSLQISEAAVGREIILALPSSSCRLLMSLKSQLSPLLLFLSFLSKPCECLRAYLWWTSQKFSHFINQWNPCGIFVSSLDTAITTIILRINVLHL